MFILIVAIAISVIFGLAVVTATLEHRSDNGLYKLYILEAAFNHEKTAFEVKCDKYGFYIVTLTIQDSKAYAYYKVEKEKHIQRAVDKLLKWKNEKIKNMEYIERQNLEIQAREDAMNRIKNNLL